MRVFLDTNVLASAFATRGLCADVFREVLAAHDLLTSRLVLDELKRVLKEKFHVGQSLIADVIALLQEDAILAQPGSLPDMPLRDRTDLIILSSALSAKADVFVTGDKEILESRRAADVEIVSPREFWEQHAARPQGRITHGRPRRSR